MKFSPLACLVYYLSSRLMLLVGCSSTTEEHPTHEPTDEQQKWYTQP
jgi:hypothetical protein